jgi:hypothetical protein
MCQYGPTNRVRICKEVKLPHYRPGQAQRVPGGRRSQIWRQAAHEGGKLVSPTHRPPLPPRKYSLYCFCYRLSRPQGHSAAERIMSMKNSNDTTGNRTRGLPFRSAVPQSTAPREYVQYLIILAILVAARCKAWICRRSLAGIVISNPAGGMEVCFLWVLCVVTQGSLRRADHLLRVVLQEYGASACDREATAMKGPWPTRGCCAIGGGGFKNFVYVVQYSRCVKRAAFRHLGVWCFHLLYQGFTNVVLCVFMCAKYSCSCPYAIKLKTSVT